MEREQRAQGLVGLALRARKVETGAEAVLQAMEKGKVRLLLLAADAAAATCKRMEQAAEGRSIAVLHLGSKDEWGRLCGREQVAVLGVTDPGFARGLLKLA